MEVGGSQVHLVSEFVISSDYYKNVNKPSNLRKKIELKIEIKHLKSFVR